MYIRKLRKEDLEKVYLIYDCARNFMIEHNNPTQWGNEWPPKDLIQNDVTEKKGYVCISKGEIVAVFYYNFGLDIDPTYRIIENGNWSKQAPYGVVHRIASIKKGAGTFCLKWAINKAKYLRIDTHENNYVMINLLTKLGFSYRGIIHIEKDNSPRVAYDFSY